MARDRDVAAFGERAHHYDQGRLGQLHHQIADRTEGVPLFIEELTKSVLESGLLHDEENRYVLDRALRPFAIPTTLHDSLLTRLDRLASVRPVAILWTRRPAGHRPPPGRAATARPSRSCTSSTALCARATRSPASPTGRSRFRIPTPTSARRG